MPGIHVGTGDGLRPSPTNAIHRSWLDEFGTLVATLEGRSGGRSIMVISALEYAENTLQVLQAIPSFKGRILLAVLEQLHAAPLEVLIKANQPDIVVSLEMNCAGIATRGGAITTQPKQVTSSTGMAYLEPRHYPAWTAGHLEPAITPNLECPSIPASVAASLKTPCAVCNLASLPNLLESLLVQNS